ncbi:IclR family transcriptional regulator [Pseudalkalibacillus decolorationis]|uniref:IclR family transcriptional regulator n=1 Tax=Pseudalkalibacillus decolorationis TaxID=163879 RepID=UPI0021498769|nr:IclR family transcriptional regulator [Pseudalkalibacillus decolorationis]
MGQKYWVPGIERANLILNLIATEPTSLRLSDLCNRLEINKSSMYSLLNTLESLGWIVKEKGDTYSLGPALGSLSAAYFRQFNILQSFYKEAALSVNKINEHIQLGILEGGDVVYLGKAEGDSRVRLITDPGMKFPAYASAIGKVQLSQYDDDKLEDIYPEYQLEPKTPYTLKNLKELSVQLKQVKNVGYAIENQEASLGFHCVAAPIINYEDNVIAGVSFTMMENSWNEKKEAAREEIIDLARRLSSHAGQVSPLISKN